MLIYNILIQFRPFIHYFLHFGLPIFLAIYLQKYSHYKWYIIYLILISTMLIDIDHLLASPIFDSCRCSINFHPLHSYIAIVGYMGLFFYKKTRLISIGLLLHILTDFIDCQLILL